MIKLVVLVVRQGQGQKEGKVLGLVRLLLRRWGGGVAEGVQKMLGAPTASMVNAALTAPSPATLPAPSAAQAFPYTTTTSNIDASRDPRRR
jgi:hypothetical protein